MVDQYTAPINHDGASAFGTTAAGAAGGALKGGIKTGAKWFLGAVAVGALIGIGLFTGGAGFLGSGLLWSAVAGAVGGGIIGAWGLPLVAGIGAAWGGYKGGSRAHDRVMDERGAAAAVQAQIDMARAQTTTQAPVMVYAPSATANNKYNFPTQGSEVNAAMPMIQGGAEMQYDGRVNGQQLAQAM